MGTSGGIQAGVMWTIVAGIQSFIKDRWKIDPAATVVFTGGDGQVRRPDCHRSAIAALTRTQNVTGSLSFQPRSLGRNEAPPKTFYVPKYQLGSISEK